MKYLNEYWKNILFAIIFIVGIIIMVNSVKYGEKSALHFLTQNGGNMEHNTYMF